MNHSFTSAFTFAAILPPVWIGRHYGGEPFGGGNERLPIGPKGGDGSSSNVGGKSAVQEGRDQSVSDDVRLFDGIGADRTRAPVNHHIEGGERQMLDGHHPPEGLNVRHHAILRLARLAYAGPSLNRVRIGGQR